MRRYLVGLMAAGFLGAASADVVHLKCVIDGVKADTTHESWMAIDPRQNVFRVDGVAYKLMMTNDAYASVTDPVAGFRTKRVIDRVSGEVTVTEFYNAKPAWECKGLCEAAQPPARKF